MKIITLRRYTVCIFQGSTCVERVRNVRGHARATELALLGRPGPYADFPSTRKWGNKIKSLLSGAGSSALVHLGNNDPDRDLAHEADMREYEREQRAGDDNYDPIWDAEDNDDEAECEAFQVPDWKYLVCL